MIRFLIAAHSGRLHFSPFTRKQSRQLWSSLILAILSPGGGVVGVVPPVLIVGGLEGPFFGPRPESLEVPLPRISNVC